MSVPAASKPPALDMVAHPALREVVLHWHSLLQGGDVPERRALDPALMKRALPYLWLCEKEPAGGFRFRLAGLEIGALLRQNLRGRLLEEVLNAAEWRELAAKLGTVLGVPALLWSDGPLFESARSSPLGECVMMPMKERGALAIVLGATTYDAHLVGRAGRLHPVKTTKIVPVRDL